MQKCIQDDPLLAYSPSVPGIFLLYAWTLVVNDCGSISIFDSFPSEVFTISTKLWLPRWLGIEVAHGTFFQEHVDDSNLMRKGSLQCRSCCMHSVGAAGATLSP